MNTLRVRATAVTLLIVLALAACAGGTEQGGPVEGRWEGASGTVSLRVNLRHLQGTHSLEGNYRIDNGGAILSSGLTGHYQSGTLTLDFGDGQPIGPSWLIASTTDGRTFTGTLTLRNGTRYESFMLARE